MISRRRVVESIAWALALAGFLFCAWGLGSREFSETGGTGSAGADAFAYWRAGRHLLAGTPVYDLTVGQHGAYLYPPPLAQLVAPLSLLPLWVFGWGWRLVEVLALRVAVGSWRTAGISMLIFPPVFAEIEAANVNLVIAAAVAEAIRGRAWAIGPTALTKLTALTAIPAVFRFDRRGLAAGLAVAVVIVGVSVLLSPGLWQDYLAVLGRLEDPTNQFYNVGRLVPTELRLGAAALLAIAAWRYPILAPIAVTFASPVLWFNTLSTLVACWAALEIGRARRVREPGGLGRPSQAR